MINNNCRIECKPGKFNRLLPYQGMLLTAEDFLEEQTYFREKIKLHNRLHGYGVVCGLEIMAKDQADSSIIVKRGMALDWNGNEIIVCHDHTIDLSDKIRELFYKLSGKCLTPSGAPQENKEKNLYIGIKYQEIPAKPEAVFASDCGEKKRCEFSRIQEGYCIEGFTCYNLPWQPQEVIQGEQECKAFNCHPWDLDCPLHEDREHYVILGSITFNNNVQSISRDMVKNFRKHLPAHIESHPWSISPDQFIAREMVESICKGAGWINIAFVVGMKKDDAITELINKGFKEDKIKPVALSKTNLRSVLCRAVDYLPFASLDDEIELIHDENNVVLFPIITPL